MGLFYVQGRNEGRGARESQFPGRRVSAGGAKSPNNITSTVLSSMQHICLNRNEFRFKAPTVSQVLSPIQYICFRNEFRFKNGGAKRASCPGCHLTSLRPCLRRLHVSQRRNRSPHVLTIVTIACYRRHCYVVLQEMYQRQSRLLRYILEQADSRDAVLQILGLQKHQKQRCHALETVALTFNVMGFVCGQ